MMMLGVGRTNVFDGEPRSFEGAGQPVGQQHIGAGKQTAEKLAADLRFEVDRDAALAPIAQLEHEIRVHPRSLAGKSSDDERPAGVAELDAFHLDYVRTPVRQRHSGGRHVGP